MHDYESFYRQEIEHRRELNYPPFSQLVNLLISGIDEKKVIKVADDLAEFLNRRIATGVLGPAPAILSRLRNEWRYQILIKNGMCDEIKETLGKVVVPSDVRVTIDVDPLTVP